MRPLFYILPTILHTAAASLDPSLHRSFYGLAYTPEGVLLPECGAIQENVTADIELIAQLTPRLRMYGADCNATALVLQAIQDTNADLTIWPCVYIDVPYNDTVVQRQWNTIMDALQTYGTDHIGGIIIGNEYLLNSYGDSGTPTDANGVAARAHLASTIASLNTSLASHKFNKHIPLGTSDAGSAITTDLCSNVDFFMANDHPWFGGVPIDQAANWTWNFFEQNDVATCNTYNTEMFIGETGWPTDSLNASLATDGPSIASAGNLDTFLDTFVCQANTNNTPYFYFLFKLRSVRFSVESDEQFDPVAGFLDGGVEPYWGLFDSNRNLKQITIPDCEVTSPTGGNVSQLNTSPSSDKSKSAGLQLEMTVAFKLTTASIGSVALTALSSLY